MKLSYVSLQVPTLLVALIPSTLSVRCWLTILPGYDPAEYPIDFPPTHSCYRFNFPCSATDTTTQSSPCFGKATGFEITYHGAINTTIGNQMLASGGQAYKDVKVCSSPNYCNAPIVAITYPTTITDPTKGPKCWMTVIPGEDPVRNPVENKLGGSCYRGTYVCKSTDVTKSEFMGCYGKSVGYTFKVFGAANATEIQTASAFISDLHTCSSTHYCNDPSAASIPPVAPPVATPVAPPVAPPVSPSVSSSSIASSIATPIASSIAPSVASTATGSPSVKSAALSSRPDFPVTMIIIAIGATLLGAIGP